MNKPHHIGLFATCLVNNIRPSIGFDIIELLERHGYNVHVPLSQTCCGQVAYNNGDNLATKNYAEKFIHEFDACDAIIIPSGSCAAMVIKHYASLFDSNSDMYKKVHDIANKTYELCTFMSKYNVTIVNDTTHDTPPIITYHDSCSGLRELSIKEQPRQLLKQQCGMSLVEMEDSEVCCGFGGTFCVKYSAISTKIVDEKNNNIKHAITHHNVSHISGGDLGCLMNIKGRLSREGISIKALHIAEILNGKSHRDGIGD